MIFPKLAQGSVKLYKGNKIYVYIVINKRSINGRS
jgi:hypothetical protein